MYRAVIAVIAFTMPLVSAISHADHVEPATVEIKNRGAYTLEYTCKEYADNRGDSVEHVVYQELTSGNLTTGRNSTCTTAIGQPVWLKAIAGKQTTLYVTRSGSIKCKGTTIIGFGCGYE